MENEETVIHFVRRQYYAKHKTKLSISTVELTTLHPVLYLGSRRPRGRSAFRLAHQFSDDLRSVHALARLCMAKRNRNLLLVLAHFRLQASAVMGDSIYDFVYAGCRDSFIFPDEAVLHSPA